MSLTSQVGYTKAEAWIVNGNTSIRVWRPAWGGFHSLDSYIETAACAVDQAYLDRLCAEVNRRPDDFTGKFNINWLENAIA